MAGCIVRIQFSNEEAKGEVEAGREIVFVQ